MPPNHDLAAKKAKVIHDMQQQLPALINLAFGEPTSGTAPLTVEFSSSALDPNGPGSGLRYRWEFGDDSSALGPKPRFTGTSPARCISQPMNGIRNSSALESHFISQGRWERRKMSAKDSWLATATAWFSATTGLSEVCRSSSYRATICGQSVASALGASSWTAAIAAWSWYGPSGAAASAAR